MISVFTSIYESWYQLTRAKIKIEKAINLIGRSSKREIILNVYHSWTVCARDCSHAKRLAIAAASHQHFRRACLSLLQWRFRVELWRTNIKAAESRALRLQVAFLVLHWQEFKHLTKICNTRKQREIFITVRRQSRYLKCVLFAWLSNFQIEYRTRLRLVELSCRKWRNIVRVNSVLYTKYELCSRKCNGFVLSNMLRRWKYMVGVQRLLFATERLVIRFMSRRKRSTIVKWRYWHLQRKLDKSIVNNIGLKQLSRSLRVWSVTAPHIRHRWLVVTDRMILQRLEDIIEDIRCTWTNHARNQVWGLLCAFYH
jgi:hypothetical protein